MGNVYGPNSFREKQTFISFLKCLKEQIDTRNWVLIGGFNLISNLVENKGGRRILDKYQEAFYEFLAQSSLVDLETGKGWHTWNNKRGGRTWWPPSLIDFWCQRILFIVQGKLQLMFSLQQALTIGPSAFPGIGQDPPWVSCSVLNSSSWNINTLRTLSINGGRSWFSPRNNYVSFSAETQGSEGQNPHVKEGIIWEHI